MNIRPFDISDYDTVYELWTKCNFELGASDTRDEIHKFIKMNPSTSLVGEIGNKIISSVLGGYDGRRGLIHHLSVDPVYQKTGYGRQMLQALEKRFKEIGIVKISFWVKKSNIKVVKFYNKYGYESREDIITMSKVL